MPSRPPSQCSTVSCSAVTSSKYCDDCRKANTKVYIVTGPSGSGKSTYVAKHAKRGDLILDLDLMFAAFSGCAKYDKPEQLLPFVIEARDSIISRIGEVDDVPCAWLIYNKITQRDLNRIQYATGGEVIEMRASAEVCKSRIDNDPERSKDSRPFWHNRIDEWFEVTS